MSDALAAGAGRRRASRRATGSPSTCRTSRSSSIAVLATWKAGGIVVPVNPMNKERELDLRPRGLGRHGAGHAGVAVRRRSSARSSLAAGVRTVITTSELDLADRRPAAERARGVERNRPADTLDLLELVAAHDGEAPPAVDARPRRRRLPDLHVGHDRRRRRGR